MLERTLRPGLPDQRQPQPGSLSPERAMLAQFHTRIANNPAFSRLSARSQVLITGYLTTDSTLRELAQVVQRSHGGTNYKIKTGIRRI